MVPSGLTVNSRAVQYVQTPSLTRGQSIYHLKFSNIRTDVKFYNGQVALGKLGNLSSECFPSGIQKDCESHCIKKTTF